LPCRDPGGGEDLKDVLGGEGDRAADPRVGHQAVGRLGAQRPGGHAQEPAGFFRAAGLLIAAGADEALIPQWIEEGRRPYAPPA